MPAEQKAVVSWEDEFRFEDEASKENSENWYWKIRGNSEFKGKESKVQKLGHKLGEQAIPFQSVRGKTITREEVLSAAFDSPPKLGPKSFMLEGGGGRWDLSIPLGRTWKSSLQASEILVTINLAAQQS